MRLVASGYAQATRPVRKLDPADKATRDANVTLTVEIPDGIDDEAITGIQFMLNREATRAAQIAAVNLRDQVLVREEAARLKTVPKDRPVIIVGPKSDDPDAAASVLHGWRDANGNITLADHPTKGAEIKKKIADYTKTAKAHPRGVPMIEGAK